MDYKYDVVIAGGGIAGLCLARQIKMTKPVLTILVLDKEKAPFASATHKVGESSIEVGAYYYSHILGMKDYIEEAHYEKLGLRYFLGGGANFEDFSKRPEYGVDDFLPGISYQFNRGDFENYLRALIVKQGIVLMEGALVEDINISSGDTPNTVSFKKDGEEHECTGNWVVDATGRRKILQNKLGLSKYYNVKHSSVWFRVKGRCSVSSFVAEDKVEWQNKIKRPRWLSTNHLMGNGYWVWLIPLKGDYTSIGIVACEDIHAFNQFNTKEKALNWMAEKEPHVAKALENFELLDFKSVKNYSHTSSRLFSEDRWACVGEAGVFADPFYSVGSNLIAYANGMVTNLICSDFDADTLKTQINHYNSFLIAHCESLTYIIQSHMSYMGNSYIGALKIIWDTFVGWGVSDPIFYNNVYLDPEKSKQVNQILFKLSITQVKMVNLFQEWASKTKTNGSYNFLDCLKNLPSLNTIYVNNLHGQAENFEQVLTNMHSSIEKIGEVANVIFFLAIRELYPEEYAQLDIKWVNPTKISLNKARWEKSKIFKDDAPKDISQLFNEIALALNVPLMEQKATKELTI